MSFTFAKKEVWQFIHDRFDNGSDEEIDECSRYVLKNFMGMLEVQINSLQSVCKKWIYKKKLTMPNTVSLEVVRLKNDDGDFLSIPRQKSWSIDLKIQNEDLTENKWPETEHIINQLITSMTYLINVILKTTTDAHELSIAIENQKKAERERNRRYRKAYRPTIRRAKDVHASQDYAKNKLNQIRMRQQPDFLDDDDEEDFDF